MGKKRCCDAKGCWTVALKGQTLCATHWDEFGKARALLKELLFAETMSPQGKKVPLLPKSYRDRIREELGGWETRLPDYVPRIEQFTKCGMWQEDVTHKERVLAFWERYLKDWEDGDKDSTFIPGEGPPLCAVGYKLLKMLEGIGSLRLRVTTTLHFLMMVDSAYNLVEPSLSSKG